MGYGVLTLPAEGERARASPVRLSGFWGSKCPSVKVTTVTQVEPESDQESEPGDKSFARGARVLTSVTVLSRFSGLLRDAVIARLLGAGRLSDSFMLAFLIPNLFRRLFGEGAISAAFIPEYARLARDDRGLSSHFAGDVVRRLFAVLFLLVVVGEMVIGSVVLSVPLGPDLERTAWLLVWMLPYAALVCVVALIAGVLQVEGRFFPGAASPLILNGVLILAGIGAGQVTTPERAVYLLAAGVILAGLLQLVWILIYGKRFLVLSRPTRVEPALGNLWRAFLPSFGGLAVFQLNTLFDSVIAWALSNPQRQTFLLFGVELGYPLSVGSVATLAWAQRLQQFPIGVFSVAIATAVFPWLSRAAGTADFAPAVRDGLRLSLFISLPAAAGLALVAFPLTQVIYEGDAFTPADTARVTSILYAYTAAIPSYSLIHVLTRSFYARSEPKVPLQVGLLGSVLNLALNLVLVWPLGAPGLAWSSSLSALIQALALAVILARRIDFDLRVLARSAACTLLSTLLMTAVVVTWLRWVPLSSPWLILATAIPIGGVTYGVSQLLIFRSPEGRWLLR